MAGKFVIKKGASGKFRFNLLARNGQVVATSEAYGSKAAAMAGIRSVQRLAGDAAIEDQTTKEWSQPKRPARRPRQRRSSPLPSRQQEGLRPGKAPETLLKG